MKTESESRRIGRELARRVRGEVMFDEVSRALYSTAACLYQVKPLGAVAPRDTEDLINVVDFARHEGIPLTARGAGSGLAGQAIGPGIIVDFSLHMNGLKEIDAEESLVHVEPGLVCGKLNRAVAPLGKFFPPDPSTSDYCTLGGMLGNNSSGAHSVKYGNTIDYVESIEVLLSDGSLWKLSTEEEMMKDFRGQEIYRALKRLIVENRAIIEDSFPRLPKNCSGYPLDRVEKDGRFNLARLFVGSEGTLGFITSAALKVVDSPSFKSLSLFYFDGLEKAGEAVVRALELQPSVLEIMDRRCLDKCREARPDLKRFMPEGAEALLLVEFDGHDSAMTGANAEKLGELLIRKQKLASGMERAEKAEEQQTLWAVRKAMLPLLNRLRGPRRVASFIEDAAVPPERLMDYVRGLYEIVDGHGAEIVLFGHAGQGNLHTRPLLNLKDDADVRRMQSISREVHHLVISLRGTVSGEHGDGLVRSEYLPEQYGPAYELMREVKAVLDPFGLMNPGKIIDVAEGTMSKNLRYGAGYKVCNTATLLQFESGEFQGEVEGCHGCAECRTPFKTMNMCPVFKVNPQEMATPRAKANLLRNILSGKLPEETLYSPQVKKMLELCIDCKSCSLDCPSQVNIPKIWDEVRARYYERKGRSLQQRILGDLDALSSVGASLAPVSNVVARGPGMLVAGVSSRHRLPPFRRDTFLARHFGEKVGSGEIKAALFVDTYINYYGPEIGEAFMELLLTAGVAAYVPEQVGCGMAQLCNGGSKKAREMARFNLNKLAAAVAEGYLIVSLEPTATLCLRQEYMHLLPVPEAKFVADRVEDASEFLLGLYGKGKLPSGFRPLEQKAGYHTPCHLRASGIGKPALKLLSLVPGLEVVDINEGCCGMAGTFGLKSKQYATSMAIGEGLLKRLREPDIHLGISDCSSCRMQMEHGSGKRALHPVEVIAVALGLRNPFL